MHNIACEKETRIKNLKRLLRHNFENGFEISSRFPEFAALFKKREKYSDVLFIPYNVIGGYRILGMPSQIDMIRYRIKYSISI
jgi:hypothetical protein